MKAKAQGKTGRPDSSPKRQPRRNVLLGGAIVAIALIVYIPALRSGYVWDDACYVPKGPDSPGWRLIADEGGLGRIWRGDRTVDYWPLTHTSFWLEWRLWGQRPAGYHVMNVLLHALAAVLLWRVLKSLNVPGAYLAGLIFAVHPVCVASVAWISERKNTLSMVFCLLAILAYLRSERSGSRRWYVAAVAAFALGLLSKTSIVMLPVVLLGCAWWQRGKIAGKDLLRCLPLFALAAVMAIVTLRFHTPPAVGDEATLLGEGPLVRLAGAGWAAWFYLYKAMLPVNLSMIYPRWNIDAASIVSYLPLIALVAGLAVLFRYRRSWARPLLFAIGYFMVTLFPVMGFFDMSFMKHSLVADHFQYVSIIGLIALAAGGLTWLARRRRTTLRAAAMVAAVAIVAGLSVLTWRQASIYKDEQTLWKDTLAKNKNAAGAHNGLGSFYAERGEFGRAAPYFQAAIGIRPNFANAHYNLGVAYKNAGRFDKAIEHLRRSLEVGRPSNEAHFNLGYCHTAKGELDKAIEHYRQAIQLRGDDSDAHYNLGILHARRGELAEAIRHYHKTIQFRPDHAIAYNNLGNIHADTGRLDEAERCYSKAIQLQPRQISAQKNLGIILQRQGKLGQAVACFRRALAIDANDLTALRNLAWLLATAPQEELRDGRQAVQLAQKACRLRAGNSPVLLDTLAAAYAETGQFARAIEAAEKALKLLGEKTPTLAEDIRNRLGLYKAHKPYRQGR